MGKTIEFIDREKAIEAFDDPSVDRYYGDVDPDSVIRVINSIPAADVRPVVRGKWEDVEVTYVADKTTLPFERISSMRCNQCNRYHTEIYYYGNPTEMANYCPNCGADMREGN